MKMAGNPVPETNGRSNLGIEIRIITSGCWWNENLFASLGFQVCLMPLGVTWFPSQSCQREDIHVVCLTSWDSNPKKECKPDGLPDLGFFSGTSGVPRDGCSLVFLSRHTRRISRLYGAGTISVPSGNQRRKGSKRTFVWVWTKLTLRTLKSWCVPPGATVFMGVRRTQRKDASRRDPCPCGEAGSSWFCGSRVGESMAGRTMKFMGGSHGWSRGT